MEEFTSSWAELFFTILLLVGLYLLLMVLSDLIRRSNLFGKYNEPVHNFLELLIKIFEPLSILIGTVVFVSINPIIHGALVGLLIVFTFSLLKNYVHGRLFLIAHKLKVGQRIEVQNVKGVISDMQRMGLTLQTKNGSRFIHYSSLMAEGYLLLKGEEIGGLHNIILSPKVEGEMPGQQIIRNKLFACPYIDWNFIPKINTVEKEDKLKIQVLLREEQHLSHLTRLINEWGCETRLSK